MITPQSTLAEIRSAITDGHLSADEAARFYWERATRLNDLLNAFSWLDAGLSRSRRRVGLVADRH